MSLIKKEIVSHFDKTWKDYDKWYETHQAVFQSELNALEKAMPSGRGLEVGVGTGRFAASLSVTFGLDPSFKMLKLAKARKIKAVQGFGEELPFKSQSFHFVSIVFTIEFVDDPIRFLKEAVRTLKKNGELVLGMLDRESEWGKYYERNTSRKRFFRSFTPEEILKIFKGISLEFKEAFQTLFQPPPDIKKIEEPRRGYGQGGFVVLKGKKI